MKVAHLLFASAIALCVPATIHAEKVNPALKALDDALPGNLINDPSKLDWPVFGPGVGQKSVKDAGIPGGGGALQITIPKVGATAYEIGANAPITKAVKPGQQVLIAFYARTIKADTPNGKGKIGIRFQRNSAPYPGFGDTTLTIGTEWELYEVKATANTELPAGLGVVNFQLSGAKQVVQIGQTIIIEGATTIKQGGASPAANAAPVMLPQLEGKGKVINDPASQAWEFYGEGTHIPVTAKGMPGGSAIAFNVPSLGKNAYDIGANVPIKEAIAQGDVLTLAFLARTVSAETPNGAGKIGIRVQRNAAPYDGFGDNTLAIGPNWKLYQVRTQAKMDMAAGQARMALHFAGAKQSVEVGPVYVLNAGPPAPAPAAQ